MGCWADGTSWPYGTTVDDVFPIVEADVAEDPPSALSPAEEALHMQIDEADKRRAIV